MATDYFDALSDEDEAALETALGNQDAVLTGKGADADALSGILDGAPAIGKDTTIYRYYDQANLDAGSPLHTFVEPGFVVGSTTKPAVKPGAAVFAFKVPSGVKALQVDAEHYVLGRGLTVAYSPSTTDIVPATALEWFQNGKALVAGGRALMKFNTGYIPPMEERESLEEFYNHAHGRGGRFAPGGGGGSGGGGGGGSSSGGGQGTHQGNQGNKGQHQRHGQGGPTQSRPGGFQGNRPQGGGKPKLTKPEEHLHRTANIVRSVVGIASVVVTAAAIINAIGNLSDTKGTNIQRQANKARNQETVRRSKPQFKSKDDEAVFHYLNPSGKFVRPNPERVARQGQNVTNIS